MRSRFSAASNRNWSNITATWVAPQWGPIVLFALLPVATHIPALATLAIVTAVLAVVIAFETRSYGEGRGRVRHEDFVPDPSHT